MRCELCNLQKPYGKVKSRKKLAKQLSVTHFCVCFGYIILNKSQYLIKVMWRHAQEFFVRRVAFHTSLD